MNIELIRLGTFVSWPYDAPVGARELSSCGFFVSNNRILQVECAWCHCRISDWKEGDDVWGRHRAVSPQCKFIIDHKNSENAPLPQVKERERWAREVPKIILCFNKSLFFLISFERKASPRMVLRIFRYRLTIRSFQRTVLILLVTPFQPPQRRTMVWTNHCMWRRIVWQPLRIGR